MTGLDPTIARHAPASTVATAQPALVAGSAPQSLVSSRQRSSRLARYLVTRAWVHVTLLFFVAIFLFPFVYMFATSMKTDEELIERRYFPAIPTFQPASPRVREIAAVQRPAEAPPERWEAALPELTTLTRAAVDAAPLPVGADSVDAHKYRDAATQFLLHRLVP